MRIADAEQQSDQKKRKCYNKILIEIALEAGCSAAAGGRGGEFFGNVLRILDNI